MWRRSPLEAAKLQTLSSFRLLTAFGKSNFTKRSYKRPMKVLPKHGLKSGRRTDFNEENLLLVESGRLISDIESKAYDNKTLTKKAKAREEIEKKI